MSEIIIDGVDVSGCRYYHYKGCPARGTKCDFESSECYYKQLKRLQAENEELKERLEQAEEDIKSECLTCKNLISLEQENEELKKENSKIVWDEVCTTNCSKYKAYNKYRKALEEIREMLCEGRTFYDGYFDNEHLSRKDKAIKIINEVLG